MQAADIYEVAAETVTKWRSGGFTSIAAVPRQGIFPGQTSLLNLGDGSREEQVIAPAVALAIRIPSDSEAYSGFPGSLLGRIAYVRQVFLDADAQRQALAIYRDNPAGLRRPPFDRALSSLIEALDAGRPALYPANTAVEIGRAVRLAAEEASPPMIVYGAQQAYEPAAASALAAARLSALVNVSWPKPPNDPDPAAEPSLRQLALRRHAPESPAALAAAGVPFAFYAGEASGPDELLDGVRQAVEAGLDPEAALTALTLTPARLYGVADRLGSLEAGKIANLAIFQNDPLTNKAKPTMVFVDGRRYDVE